MIALIRRSYAETGRSATITVTRVALKTELSTQPIPFARQLIRDETYPQGQVRVVQLGSNGAVAITQTITLENGQETARRETARNIVAKPKDEILALGTQGISAVGFVRPAARWCTLPMATRG